MAPTPELFPGGSWQRPWTAGEDGGRLEVTYEAGGAFATIEGTGTLTIELDGSARSIEVRGAALHQLSDHLHHERHTVALGASPGLRIWSLSFAAGVPMP